MDLQIAKDQITTKTKTIKKEIKLAMEELECGSITAGTDMLDELLDRMDNGTDVVESTVPNRTEGDLSFKEELKYMNSVTLTMGNNYV